MAANIYLTGIKPTGDFHLGNYVGAIKPALEAADSYETYYFIADYHALNTVKDAGELRRSIRAGAATWLACGLDPAKTIVYQQSKVPETFELTTVLSALTPKGLMNRAHAYKAARDRNNEAGNIDLDAGINMGLYNYPILMAADILVMEPTHVPVGRDQSQHIEYTADIAGYFNHRFGEGYTFPIPKGVIDEGDASILPGVDGRKMSKSYDNHIPLFLPENKLKKAIRRIPTDSTPVEDPKDPDSSVPFQLLRHFADADKVADVRKRLEAGGMGWGELKNELFDAVNAELGLKRERYEQLMADPEQIDAILAAGSERARQRARATIAKVRAAVGVA